MTAPSYLRCEDLVAPLGIGTVTPKLSWLPQNLRRQKAYQITATGSIDGKNILWDSGKVESSDPCAIYAGKALETHQEVHWHVRLWDQDDQEGEWSEKSRFSIGILEKSGWKGKWMGLPFTGCLKSQYIRREIQVGAKLRTARLHVATRGAGLFFANGDSVSDDVFATGWTDYRIRVLSRCYEVTEKLQEGTNCLGMILGDGWFCGSLGWQREANHYGDMPQALVHLRLEYEDGSIQEVVSDESWKVYYGPILSSGFYEGETYDATRELGDWNRTSYDDSKWYETKTFDLEDQIIEPHRGPAVRRTGEVQPTEHWQSEDGSTIFNFGQNFCGRLRLKIRAKKGQVIRLSHAEVLDEDKRLYTENLRRAVSVDTYICKGDGEEVYEPRFTFHGFQYAELTGYHGDITADTLTGIVLGSDTPRAGDFECSDDLINQLYSNIVWTQRANYLEVPTDCPQRDERLGWTGDAQVYMRTAAWNMDVASFFNKWLVDLDDACGPDGSYPSYAPHIQSEVFRIGQAGWADAGIICPWVHYLYYADSRILEEHLPAMSRYIDYLHTKAENNTLDNILPGTFYGDWLAMDNNTPDRVLATAYYAHVVGLMAKIYAVLDMGGKAEAHQETHDRIVKAFDDRFIDADGKIEGHTQTCYSVALGLEVLDSSRREQAVTHLVNRLHDNKDYITVGFLGVPHILEVLSNNGHADLAYTLLTNQGFPSWLYSVVNGATSIWERWNSWSKEDGFASSGMTSFAHYAYGCVGQWFFERICGIRLLEPGFKRFEIAPLPGGGLTRASASHTCLHGKIKSAWEISGSTFSLDIEIPANTIAEVQLPGNSEQMQMNGESVTNERLNLEAGSYRFEAENFDS